ncbi:hypothetical protein Ahy_B06g084058 [Arachis hypogaea]|uniref:Transposase MuDR plant domain-containing protein n=1 Tax=Arachis hypogaea TaxID=3818 RepID=A0A444YR22_ARAHY|nr:hypothetical protein Ahy_B06g084058 [Arachis hypogaea]
MEFSFREAVIKAIKEYTIQRSVDYRVYESEPLTFYAKCTQYGSGCDWLIRVSMIDQQEVLLDYKEVCGSHTCTRATISQDHSKLDSNTIAEAIMPLVEAEPSLKVKSVIVEVQSKFNYTVSYQKGWLAEQKVVEKIFGGWETSYEALPIWFEATCHKEPSAIVHFETMPAYQEPTSTANLFENSFFSFKVSSFFLLSSCTTSSRRPRCRLPLHRYTSRVSMERQPQEASNSQRHTSDQNVHNVSDHVDEDATSDAVDMNQYRINS